MSYNGREYKIQEEKEEIFNKNKHKLTIVIGIENKLEDYEFYKVTNGKYKGSIGFAYSITRPDKSWRLMCLSTDITVNKKFCVLC